jgi:hypothetical protein
VDLLISCVPPVGSSSRLKPAFRRALVRRCARSLIGPIVARMQAAPDRRLSVASVATVTVLMFATHTSELRFWISLALGERWLRGVSVQEKGL